MKQMIRISTIAQSTIVGAALLILTAGSTLAADQTSAQPTPKVPAQTDQSSCGCCKKMMENMQNKKPMPGMTHSAAPQ